MTQNTDYGTLVSASELRVDDEFVADGTRITQVRPDEAGTWITTNAQVRPDEAGTWITTNDGATLLLTEAYRVYR